MNNQFICISERFIGYAEQANKLFLQKEFTRALFVYMEILQTFGETADLAARISLCHSYAGLWESKKDFVDDQYKAIEWIKKAIELEPDNPIFYAQLAQLYWHLSDYQQMLILYRKALELEPNCLAALKGAIFLWNTPDDVIDLHEAIRWLEHAITIDPADSVLAYWLGVLYMESGEKNSAERIWLKAMMNLDSSEENITKNMLDYLKGQE